MKPDVKYKKEFYVGETGLHYKVLQGHLNSTVKDSWRLSGE